MDNASCPRFWQHGAEDVLKSKAAHDVGAESAWPPLDLSRWAPTKHSLHLIAQMLGKVRLALAPYQPNFVFTALYLTPRGLTTSPIPVGFRLVEIQLDVFNQRITLRSSDGRRSEVPLAELSSIAAAYAALLAALPRIGVEITISPLPQEIPDQIPLDRDDRPLTWDAQAVSDWLKVMCSTQAIFERWRAHFFGRSEVQIWWGAFDISMLLFTGKHVDPPTDRGYLFKYDLDAEMMSAGLYLGDEAHAAFFYGYIYPEPPRCNEIAISTDGATWSEQFHEWILPYDTVRRDADPEKHLQSFLSGIYEICGSVARWDRSQYSYVPPPLRRAPRKRM